MQVPYYYTATPTWVLPARGLQRAWGQPHPQVILAQLQSSYLPQDRGIPCGKAGAERGCRC